jgi:hypothetical protein
MAYATVTDVRAITNLTAEDISDADITLLLDRASQQVNSDLGVKIVKENFAANPVNILDGVNTEFQTVFYPLGDLDNDFVVGTSDVIVYNRPFAPKPFKKQVGLLQSVDAEQGLITFTNPPEINKEWRIDYMWFPLPVTDKLVNKATAELAAYFCFLKQNLMEFETLRLGKLEVRKIARHPNLVSFFERYVDTINKIRSTVPACGKPMMLRPIRYEAIPAMLEEIVEKIRPGIELARGEAP